MFLFEFPQNLAGFLAFSVLTKIKKHPYKRYKDAYVVHVPGRWGALTMSRYIFADDHWHDSEMIKHEYGHRIQSRKLLLLYLPLVGLPSMVWAGGFRGHRRKHQKSYFSFYTENWANKLGGLDLNRKKDGNHKSSK